MIGNENVWSAAGLQGEVWSRRQVCANVFEPSGWTGNKKMGYAKSPMDYIGRWLQHRFLDGEQLDLFVPPAAAVTAGAEAVASAVPEAAVANKRFGDAPMCGVCGSLMKTAGSCFSCPSCGGTSGCS
jgi:ribonucleoside-diphosphate reductase alpha chain